MNQRRKEQVGDFRRVFTGGTSQEAVDALGDQETAKNHEDDARDDLDPRVEFLQARGPGGVGDEVGEAAEPGQAGDGHHDQHSNALGDADADGEELGEDGAEEQQSLGVGEVGGEAEAPGLGVVEMGDGGVGWCGVDGGRSIAERDRHRSASTQVGAATAEGTEAHAQQEGTTAEIENREDPGETGDEGGEAQHGYDRPYDVAGADTHCGQDGVAA